MNTFPKRCLISCLSFLLWNSRVQAEQARNGDFETPDAGNSSLLSDWTIESTGVSPKPAPADEMQPHGGRRCAKLTIAEGGKRESLRQTQHLQRFCGYELSAWLRADREGMGVQVDVREAGGPQIPIAIKTFTVGRQWQHVSVRGFAPNTTDGAISISASKSASMTGTIYIDDVTLEQAAAQTTDVPPASDKEIDPLYFGMHYHEGPINTAYLPELSPKYLRLWDDHVAWTHLEPEKGHFDFSRLDAIVAHAPPDVRIILMLGQTPKWASSHPDEKGGYGFGSAYMPVKLSDWTDYLQAVGVRYKGKIKYWEIWNECNWKTFWKGNITEMVTLTKSAHDVLKSIDPTNVILSPGFTKDMGEEFINEWFYEGAGQDVDIISYHFYPTPDVDAAFTMARDLMELKKSYGFESLPLFNSEYGEKRKFRQPQILAEMNVLYWFAGIEAQQYYTFDDKAFGLTMETSPGHFDANTLNPGGVAYVQTRQWLLGAKAVCWSITPDGFHIAQLERPGGYHGYVVWKTPDKSAPRDPVLPKEGMVPEQAMVAESAVKPTTFHIPSNWQVKSMRDLTGHRAAIEEAAVEVTDAPVLLETTPAAN